MNSNRKAKKKKEGLISTLKGKLKGTGLEALAMPPERLCRITMQESVPIYCVHEQYGLIETYPGFFTKSYTITENNYSSEPADVENLLLTKYRAVLNSLGYEMEYQISIMNRSINMSNFCEALLLKEKGDQLDYLRTDLNEILLDRIASGRNNIEKIKIVTVGVHETDVKKAAADFERIVDPSIKSGFTKIQSGAMPIPIEDRLEVLYDIYNPDLQGTFMTKTKVLNAEGQIEEVNSFDFESLRESGASIADIIGPSSMQFFPYHFRIGKHFCKTLYIADYPSQISDEFFSGISSVPFNILTTMNIQPIPPKRATTIVKGNLAAANSVLADEQQALVKSGLPESMISPDTRKKVEKAEELYEDMTQNDERLFKTSLSIVIWADSMEQLEERTKTITAACQGSVVTAMPVGFRQEAVFNSALPLCCNEVPYKLRRTLKSSSAATLSLPFSSLDLIEPSGINYSMHLFTKNLVVYDRLKAMNANGFILGQPGAGKSFTTKLEILNVLLKTNADCIVIDPEAEYGSIAKLLNGEIIKIVNGGTAHINPLEVFSDYEWSEEDDGEDKNPVLAKADFILKLMEIIIKKPFGLDSIQRTIVDECVHFLFKLFFVDGILQPIPPEKMPTLTDLQLALARRNEPEARELSEGLKLYTGDGSLNAFGFQSNVNTRSRFVVYNIRDLGDQLKPIAMLTIMDSILNRMFDNQRLGKNTWFWVDEAHLLLSDDQTATFLNMLFKRARKYGGVPTAITQNVSDLLDSEVAKNIVKNSSFVQMLSQSADDRIQLAEMFNISESLQDVINSAPKGQGLIYTGKSIIPFASTFPKYRKDGSIDPIYRVLTSTMVEVQEFKEMERQKKAEEKKTGRKTA